MSRTRQQYHTNRSQASRKQNETNVTPVTTSRDNVSQKTSQPMKPRVCVQQPIQNTPQQVPSTQPMPSTPPSYAVPLSRTGSASSSVSSVSVPGFGSRIQKYSIQRQRHHSSQTTVFPSEYNSPADPRLTRYSRISEGAPRLHHASALSLSNGRSVHFEDDVDVSSLSQSCDINVRKFVPLNQRWQQNSVYSPRSRASSQSPARALDRDPSLRARPRSQSPGKSLDETPQRSRGRSQSPGKYLDSGSSSHLPSDTEYYADSDITSLRSITPESILEADATPFVRSTERKFVTGIQRSYSALKNRGGSSITTTTSNFANPKKNVRRSLPRKTQHKVTDTISEVGSSSYYASQEFSQSYSQSQDVRVMTPLVVTDRLTASAINIANVHHSKTEPDTGYMSAGADELDTDVKSPEMKSNRESGYLSCCDSVANITKVGEP